eukprot:2394366-Amphidinium_carterae.1
MHAPVKAVPVLWRHHMYGRAPLLGEKSVQACPHLGHARGTNASPDAANVAKAAPARGGFCEERTQSQENCER